MDIMIDIETLGTNTNCPVISIGAVAFDLTQEHGTFYVALDAKEQIDSKIRQIDADTIKFWMNQSNSAKSVFKEDAVAVRNALLGLSNFINSYKDIHVWGNGSTFDICILESLYKDFGMAIPWKYNKIMDYRTIKRFLGADIEMKRVGTYHNAVDDAISQAAFVQECLRQYHAIKKPEKKVKVKK